MKIKPICVLEVDEINVLLEQDEWYLRLYAKVRTITRRALHTVFIFK